MLDVGWSEMLVVGLVALLVIGPKELPNALRTFSRWMKQARKLASEFQGGINDIIREADLEDAKKAVQSVRGLNVDRAIEKVVDPTGTMKKSFNEAPPKPVAKSTAAAAATPAVAAPAAVASADPVSLAPQDPHGTYGPADRPTPTDGDAAKAGGAAEKEPEPAQPPA